MHDPMLRSALIAALVSSACAPVAGPDATPGPTTPADFADHWTPAPTRDRGSARIDPQGLRSGRQARRLSVDQLRRSLPVLLGTSWTTTVRGRSVSMFDALSRTLGEADYIQVTESATEPSPLFAKFMDDMAGQVCAEAVQADAGRREGERRVVAFPDDVMRTLRHLRLVLHAIHVPDGSSEGLESLAELHAGVIADGGSPSEAWTAVCVAMLTAPEMMAY